MEDTKKKTKEIIIPLEIYNKLVNMMKESGFNDVSEYVTFILKEIVSENEEYSEDEKIIRDRLKALGYM